jgi:hypothetical protein
MYVKLFQNSNEMAGDCWVWRRKNCHEVGVASVNATVSTFDIRIASFLRSFQKLIILFQAGVSL